MDINVKGMVNMCQIIIPYMKLNNYGKIVNISSLSGKEGRTVFGKPGESSWLAYAVSKSATIALTKGLAHEFVTDNIIVNSVCPGPILVDHITEDQKINAENKIPVGRWGTTEEVSDVVYFLSSRRNGFIVGETVSINGGTDMD